MPAPLLLLAAALATLTRTRSAAAAGPEATGVVCFANRSLIATPGGRYPDDHDLALDNPNTHASAIALRVPLLDHSGGPPPGLRANGYAYVATPPGLRPVAESIAASGGGLPPARKRAVASAFGGVPPPVRRPPSAVP